MKKTLNIDIESDLLDAAEEYAKNNNTALSELVEVYFKRLLSSKANRNILQLINELEPTSLSENNNLKQQYYEDQKSRYGF